MDAGLKPMTVDMLDESLQDGLVSEFPVKNEGQAFIPIAGPSITQKEIDYVTEAVTNGWYGNAGLYQSRFEAAFAKYVGRRYALALPSCTSALHLSLLAAGVGGGDEVIVPESTWIGTAAPVSYVGATPVFADICPKSWCMDVNSFQKRITPRTKAVIVVDLYGNLPRMDEILNLARRHNIAVIEDAAQAIGAEYKGAKAGSFGFTSAFSFHGTKALTTGEGGILVTDREDVYERCRYLSDGARQPGTFWNTEVGYKYKMTGIQAALGIAQLERVEELLDFKRTLFGLYREELGEIEGVTLNPDPDDVSGTYWMVTVVIDADRKIGTEYLMSTLLGEGIATRPFFYPLSSLPAYSKVTGVVSARVENLMAYKIAKCAINLPSGYSMTKEKVRSVCCSLKKILAKSPKKE